MNNIISNNKMSSNIVDPKNNESNKIRKKKYYQNYNNK